MFQYIDTLGNHLSMPQISCLLGHNFTHKRHWHSHGPHRSDHVCRHTFPKHLPETSVPRVSQQPLPYTSGVTTHRQIPNHLSLHFPVTHRLQLFRHPRPQKSLFRVLLEVKYHVLGFKSVSPFNTCKTMGQFYQAPNFVSLHKVFECWALTPFPYKPCGFCCTISHSAAIFRNAYVTLYEEGITPAVTSQF